MIRPVLSVCVVIVFGSLFTFGMESVANPTPTDARGNPLSDLDPQKVEDAANEPYCSSRMLTAL